jgi:uncharacterized protein YndB with AHSA1/START domain
MSTQEAVVLKLSRRFNAPRKRVFEAWTNPDVLNEWWAAMPSMRPSGAELDLRPGGRYRLSMFDTENNVEHTVGGEYREVNPPERLAFTWRWESNAEQMAGSDDTLVVVEFVEDGDATEVVLTHCGFANEEIRGMHEHGWNGTFDSLEQYLSSS